MIHITGHSQPGLDSCKVLILLCISQWFTNLGWACSKGLASMAKVFLRTTEKHNYAIFTMTRIPHIKQQNWTKADQHPQKCIVNSSGSHGSLITVGSCVGRSFLLISSWVMNWSCWLVTSLCFLGLSWLPVKVKKKNQQTLRPARSRTTRLQEHTTHLGKFMTRSSVFMKNGKIFTPNLVQQGATRVYVCASCVYVSACVYLFVRARVYAISFMKFHLYVWPLILQKSQK